MSTEHFKIGDRVILLDDEQARPGTVTHVIRSGTPKANYTVQLDVGYMSMDSEEVVEMICTSGEYLERAVE